MNSKVLTLIFVLLIIFTGHVGLARHHEYIAKHDTTIRYTIKPLPLLDRVNLTISVYFKTQGDTAITVRLPQDYYGTPDLYKYVIDFEGLNGCTVDTTGKPNVRLVSPNKNGEVFLSYTLSYDPVIMDGISFAPNISASHFHVAGCQWMLPIGDILQKHRYEIAIVDAPKNWHFYSSTSSDPFKTIVYDSYYNMVSTAIGGGDQPYKKLIIHKKPVFVFVAGNYSISTDKVIDAVGKIVSLQRKWFNDYDYPYYNVTIFPRSGIIAGTCIPNQFICFIKPEITQDELNVLFSHEMFHTWLPNKIYIKPAKGEYATRYEWFTEGFTDYFARKILLDAGLLTQEKFAELVNRDIINIADNPHRSATYAGLVEASKTGKYNAAYKKLSYYRGALIALNWEATILNAGKGKELKHLVNDLYILSSKNKGIIYEQDLFDIASNYGIDAQKTLKQYILNGLPIHPLPGALGTSYKLDTTMAPSFNPGFSLEETFKTRRIKGVVENGIAYNAGLRNEMEFVDIRNSNRFGNGWSYNKPLSITVITENTRKTFEYLPNGDNISLMLFSPVK